MGAILSFYSTELERHRFHADFETSDSIAAGEQTTFFVSKKKYKGGVDIMLDSPDQFLVFWDADREYIVVINNPANPPKPGLKVKAVLQCGLRGDVCAFLSLFFFNNSLFRSFSLSPKKAQSSAHCLLI